MRARTGLYGFGDGSLFFEVVVQANKVQLVVTTAPGGDSILSSTQAINDVLGLYYSDYFTFNSSVVISGEIAISDFVTLAGSFEIGVNLLQEVTITTGLSSDLVGEPAEALIRAQFDLFSSLFPSISLSANLAKITGVPVTTLEIGGSNIQAFTGTNGPYWTDLNGDGNFSWAFNTGSGNDLSRTINAVTNPNPMNTKYSVGQVLAANMVVTLEAADGVLTIGQVGLVDESNRSENLSAA